MLIDLHTHTTASDGRLSPSELVRYAREKDLRVIAVTDHDTIEGNEEAVSAGMR
jgi:predicted metal-dependent phosphoesterase TrpH